MSTLMRKINIVSRCEGLYRTDKLKDSGLCACHHSYVLAICHHPGMTQEQLAKHLCVNKSSVTRCLSQLTENGYVERRPVEHDKRAFYVYPTEKMLSVFPEIKNITAEWNAYLANGIDEKELELFHEILDKLASRAQNYITEKEESER